MIRRIFALSGLVAICGCTSGATQTSSQSFGPYRLEVRQIGLQDPEPPLVLSCAEASHCQGETRVRFGEKLQTMMVVALPTKGAVYLKFFIEGEALFVRAEPYVYLGAGHSEIFLHDKLSQTYLDDGLGLLKRPIVRSPPTLIKISIDVDQSPADGAA